MSKRELEDLQKELEQKDRRALAQAITLIESENTYDREQARQLLKGIKKSPTPSLRLAISGPPGVGKSTFINELGQALLKLELKVAILPIDPASPDTGGSILADKTRMSLLINDPDVFIRPSSSRGILGGISIALSDVILLVESYDFDIIIIETVGVGQSESLAYCLADYFLMLMQPGAGDGLSAMKKGIMERADYLVVNKADGHLKISAQQTFTMLKAIFPHGVPEIFLISSQEKTGIDALISSIMDNYQKRADLGAVGQERARRFTDYFRFAFSHIIASKIYEIPWVKARYNKILQLIVEDERALLLLLNELGDNIVEQLKANK